MVAKPHLEDTGSARAGMPLARAQRLTAKSASNKAGGRGIGIAVALVTAGLVGVSLYASGTGETVPQISAAVAQPEQTEVASAPVQPQPVAQRQAWVPPCISRIERALQDLHFKRTADHAWPEKRAKLQSLAQAGLDCDSATVEMNGNFDLAESALASMQVNWDRSAAVLRLTIVDSMATNVDTQRIQNDGKPVRFVVH